MLKKPSFLLFLTQCFLHCLGGYTMFSFTSVRPKIVNLTQHLGHLLLCAGASHQ